MTSDDICFCEPYREISASIAEKCKFYFLQMRICILMRETRRITFKHIWIAVEIL